MGNGAKRPVGSAAQGKGRTGVLAVGSVMVDRLCSVPRLPKSGEGIVCTSSGVALGGCALNAANVARQLGADVRLFVPVGEGPNADFVWRELAARGFDDQCMPGGAGSGLDCGIALCLVEPSGERSMVTIPGIERSFDAAWFDILEAEDLSGIRYGFASGYELEPAGGDAIVGFFERHPEICLWYAPGPRTCAIPVERVRRIDALRPVWHLNEAEACAYTGCPTVERAGAYLALTNGNAAIVTVGSEGAVAFVAAGGSSAFGVEDPSAWTRLSEGSVLCIHVPTVPIDVRDTVGAGDAHLGALCSARAVGLSWERSLDIANRAAGAVCRARGAGVSDAEFARMGLRLA